MTPRGKTPLTTAELEQLSPLALGMIAQLYVLVSDAYASPVNGDRAQWAMDKATEYAERLTQATKEGLVVPTPGVRRRRRITNPDAEE